MQDFRATIAATGECLLDRVESAITIRERFQGLMLRKDLPEGHGLLIPDCSSVHTCFMRFPIDLVYLCADNRVVKIVPYLKPWRLSACHRARSVLEIPAGWAKQEGLKEGDVLLFDFAREPQAETCKEEAPVAPR
jgi:uncharacterized membrane protein (UPF0127 family)